MSAHDQISRVAFCKSVRPRVSTCPSPEISVGYCVGRDLEQVLRTQLLHCNTRPTASAPPRRVSELLNSSVRRAHIKAQLYCIVLGRLVLTVFLSLDIRIRRLIIEHCKLTLQVQCTWDKSCTQTTGANPISYTEANVPVAVGQLKRALCQSISIGCREEVRSVQLELLIPLVLLGALLFFIVILFPASRLLRCQSSSTANSQFCISAWSEFSITSLLMH